MYKTVESAISTAIQILENTATYYSWRNIPISYEYVANFHHIIQILDWTDFNLQTDQLKKTMMNWREQC